MSDLQEVSNKHLIEIAKSDKGTEFLEVRWNRPILDGCRLDRTGRILPVLDSVSEEIDFLHFEGRFSDFQMKVFVLAIL